MIPKKVLLDAIA